MVARRGADIFSIGSSANWRALTQYRQTVIAERISTTRAPRARRESLSTTEPLPNRFSPRTAARVTTAPDPAISPTADKKYSTMRIGRFRSCPSTGRWCQ